MPPTVLLSLCISGSTTAPSKGREYERLHTYRLTQPDQLAIDKYIRSVLVNMLADREALLKFKEEFMSLYASVVDTLSRAELEKTVGRLAAKRLVCKALQVLRRNAGFLLASVKHVKSLPLAHKKDFGKGCHTKSTEPYFYEAAYLHVRESLIPINDEGECVVGKLVPLGDGSDSDVVPPKGKLPSSQNVADGPLSGKLYTLFCECC